MVRNKLIWILFVLSAVLVVLSGIVLLTAPAGIKEYDVRFLVEGGTVGFDLNTSALTFGKISPGGSGTREIIFENNLDEMIEIEILATKSIASFLDYQPIYSIPAKNNVTIPITVVVPENAEEGEYIGKIRIRAKR